MIDFGMMSVEEATAYLEAYVTSLPSRHAWLARELAVSGLSEPVLQSPDRLSMMWAHVETVVQRDGAWHLRTPQPSDDLQQGLRPPWYEPDGHAVFADNTLWLIELLGAHVGQLVTEFSPDSHWGLYRVAKRLRDVNQHTTVLLDVPSGWFANPTSMVYSVMLNRFYYRRPSPSGMNTLADVYKHITTPRKA